MAQEIKIKVSPDLDKIDNAQLKKLTESVQKAYDAAQIKMTVSQKESADKKIGDINKQITKLGTVNKDTEEYKKESDKLVSLIQKFALNIAQVNEDLSSIIEENLNKIKDLSKKIAAAEKSLKYTEKQTETKSNGKITSIKESAINYYIQKKQDASESPVKYAIGSDKNVASLAGFQKSVDIAKELGTLDKLKDSIQKTFGIESQKLTDSFFDNFSQNFRDLIAEQKNLEVIQSKDIIEKGNIEIDNLNQQITDAFNKAFEKVENIQVKEIVADTIKAQQTSAAKNVQQTVQQAGQEGTQQAIQDMEAADQKIKQSNESGKKNSNIFARAAANITFYNVVVKSMKQVLSSTVSVIEEFDKVITEQAMVTGKTREEIKGLVSNYKEIASITGATITEVAGVTSEYLKQGKTVEDALILTETAVKAAKVASISTAESIDYLTVAINGFKLEAEDAMAVSDKFAALAAGSATDYEELAVALSKVASQANLAGMSMDYTLALLAKGLETSREAAESIGTALKTVIARMREITDYGETLEDGVDVNNVEKQLSFVGIALRNQVGELRSTEDVLDELGRKWDTLSSNQQASIAKALAGTRQQSRLISMMEDYDRTLELMEMSQQSAGATAAQHAEYMKGLEAAISNVKTQWESFLNALVNSDIIIGLVNIFGNALETLNTMKESIAGQVVLYGSIAVIIGLISNKMLANAQEKKRQQLEEQKVNLENKKNNLELIKSNKELILLAEKRLLAEKKLTQEKVYQNLESAHAALAEAEKNQDAAGIANAQADISKYELELTNLNTQITAQQNVIYEKEKDLLLTQQQIDKTNDSIGVLEQQSKTLQEQGNLFGFLGVLSNNFVTSFISGIKSSIQGVKNFSKQLSDLAKTNPILLIVTAAITALTLLDKFLQMCDYDIEGLTEKVNNGIKAQNSFNQAISDIENFDKKVIKTSEDIEELESSLQNAISVKFGEDSAEMAQFKSLETIEAKKAYVEEKSKENEEELKENRNKQREALYDRYQYGSKNAFTTLKSLGSKFIGAFTGKNSFGDIFNPAADMTDEDRANIEAHLSDMLDEQLSNLGDNDATKGSKDFAKQFYNKKISAMDNQQLIDLYGNPQPFINQAISLAKQQNVKDITSTDSNNTTKQAAYANADEATRKLMDEQGYAAYGSINADMAATMDAKRLTIKAINDFADQTGLSNAQITNILNGITDVNELTEEQRKAYGKLLDSSVGGFEAQMQSIESFSSSVNGIYETADKWNEMSQSEKASWMAQNEDLVNSGIVNAFETGDYGLIQSIIQDNYYDDYQLEVDKLKQTIEAQKLQGNDEYVKQLEKELQDLENSWYEASLDLQIKNQEKQINAYKETLQKENDALVESLNKRKEAYQEYFDEIGEMESTQEYEEQRDMLESNLLKLAGSTDAASQSMRRDLEKQLEELNKEKAKEDREKAQQAMIEDVDKQIDTANETLNNLLDNNRAMLDAIKDMNSDSFTATESAFSGIKTKINEGMTVAELQDWWNTSGQSLYSSADLSGAEIKTDTDTDGDGQPNVVINIGGETIDLGNGGDAQSGFLSTLNQFLKNIGVTA